MPTLRSFSHNPGSVYTHSKELIASVYRLFLLLHIIYLLLSKEQENRYKYITNQAFSSSLVQSLFSKAALCTNNSPPFDPFWRKDCLLQKECVFAKFHYMATFTA